MFKTKKKKEKRNPKKMHLKSVTFLKIKKVLDLLYSFSYTIRISEVKNKPKAALLIQLKEKQ